MADENVNVNVNVKGGGELLDDIFDVQEAAEKVNEEFGEMDSNVGKTTKGLKSLGNTGSKALKGIGNVGSKAFRAIGTAIKAAGIGLLIGVLGTLWEAIKRNQEIMDMFETAVNAVGIVVRPIAEAISELVKGLASGSEEFDAFGTVIKNVIKIALTPLQMTIQATVITINGLMIAWERLSARLSRKKELDEGRIAELQENIDDAKEKMRELAEEAGESFVAIKDNIGEAIDEVKTFGKDVIDSVKEAIVEVQNGAATAATEARKNIERLRLEQERLMLQYQTQAEVQRQLRDNEQSTIEERIVANRRLGEILTEQTEMEIAAVQRQIEEQKAILALDYENEEAKNAIYELETKIIDINERILGQKSEMLRQEFTLEKEREENAKAEIERQISVADEIRTIQQENSIARLEDENEAALLKLQYEQENFERELEQRLKNEEITQEELLSLREAYTEQTAILEDELTDKIAEDAKARIAIERAATQAKIDGSLVAAEALLGAADAIFGETKASAIAQTIITTYQSATSAFSSLAGIPVVGPVLGGIAAAAAVASGIANVNKIRQEGKGESPALTGPRTVPNQNPQFATGGYVNGMPHTGGGVDVELEGGEFVTRKDVMATPEGSIVEQINQGRRQHPTYEEVLGMIQAQEVYVLESKISEKQKEVKVRESRLTSG